MTRAGVAGKVEIVQYGAGGNGGGMHAVDSEALEGAGAELLAQALVGGIVCEQPVLKLERKIWLGDRVGDFYETFSDDAVVASEILGITLTRRANGAAQYVEQATPTRPPLPKCTAARKLLQSLLSTVSLRATPGVTSSVMPRFTSFLVSLGSSSCSQMATRLPARTSFGR